MERSTFQSENKVDDANDLIRYHAMGAAVVGLMPLPMLDMALLAGIQINLVRKLANVYEVPFSEEAGKSAVSALLGASAPALAWGVMRFVPAAGLIGGSLLSAAATYGVGKVFVQHFESGGTFLTFDPKKVREHFEREARKAAAKETPNMPVDPECEDYGGIKP